MTGYDLAYEVFNNIQNTDNHVISLQDTVKVISFFGFNEEASRNSTIGFVCYCARDRIKQIFENALVYDDYDMLHQLMKVMGTM